MILVWLLARFGKTSGDHELLAKVLKCDRVLKITVRSAEVDHDFGDPLDFGFSLDPLRVKHEFEVAFIEPLYYLPLRVDGERVDRVQRQWFEADMWDIDAVG